VLDVTGSSEENERLDGTDPEKMVDSIGRRWAPQLGSVTAGELGKPLRVVAVPAAQLRARRRVLEPLVQVGVGRFDAARPEPVDEDAIAGTPRVVVDAADLWLTMPRRHAISVLLFELATGRRSTQVELRVYIFDRDDLVLRWGPRLESVGVPHLSELGVDSGAGRVEKRLD
jgi:hypothetical protein